VKAYIEKTLRMTNAAIAFCRAYLGLEGQSATQGANVHAWLSELSPSPEFGGQPQSACSCDGLSKHSSESRVATLSQSCVDSSITATALKVPRENRVNQSSPVALSAEGVRRPRADCQASAPGQSASELQTAQRMAVRPMPMTVADMMSVAPQPTMRNGPVIVNRPMTLGFVVISIIVAMTGTATMPLITAVQ
jgi:hypothetical protein